MTIKKKKIVCLIQARMNSTRLPGKILMKINGTPMIILQVKILKKSKFLDEVVVITTKNSIDNKLVKKLEEENIEFFRGSENNVLKRYYDAASKYKADIIIRITSDNPLIDLEILEKIVDEIIKNKYDYVSNNLKRTFPIGYDIEAISFEALKRIFETTKDPNNQEHVTLFIHKNIEKFKTKNIEANSKHKHPNWRVTVDEKKDFELITKIFEHYKSKPLIYYNDLIELFRKNPELKKINENITQKIQ